MEAIEVKTHTGTWVKNWAASFTARLFWETENFILQYTFPKVTRSGRGLRQSPSEQDQPRRWSESLGGKHSRFTTRTAVTFAICHRSRKAREFLKEDKVGMSKSKKTHMRSGSKHKNITKQIPRNSCSLRPQFHNLFQLQQVHPTSKITTSQDGRTRIRYWATRSRVPSRRGDEEVRSIKRTDKGSETELDERKT